MPIPCVSRVEPALPIRLSLPLLRLRASRYGETGSVAVAVFGLGIGTRALDAGRFDSGSRTRDPGLGTPDSGPRTRDPGLGTSDYGTGLLRRAQLFDNRFERLDDFVAVDA
jgi:hypothetical protein